MYNHLELYEDCSTGKPSKYVVWNKQGTYTHEWHLDFDTRDAAIEFLVKLLKGNE